MNEELIRLRRMLEEKRPMDWEALPDIPLYMDQVLSYMDRQLIQSGGGDRLTSAMVNNYTKSGLVPRAEGKKYSREHLAYLTAICMLKQVMSAKDMALAVEEKTAENPEIPPLYDQFRASLDQALRFTAAEMEGYQEEERLMDGAIHFALLSYATGLASRRYMEILRANRGEPTPPKREKKTKQALTKSEGELHE